MKRFILVPVEGAPRQLEVTGDTGDAIHEGVGGWFQCVDLSPELSMWLNEEGKNDGLAHNPIGQRLWDAAYGPHTDYIVGPAVLTGGLDARGETLGLDEPTVTELLARLNRIR